MQYANDPKGRGRLDANQHPGEFARCLTCDQAVKCLHVEGAWQWVHVDQRCQPLEHVSCRKENT